MDGAAPRCDHFDLEGRVVSPYMDVFMQIRGTIRWTRLLSRLLAMAGAALAVVGETLPAVSNRVAGLDPPTLVRALATLRPDYTRYISSVRPLAPGIGGRIYMALVRPGATDPAGHGSTPFAGPGARNDIVYDQVSVVSGHSLAWRCLLLDHEYFHARHM